MNRLFAHSPGTNLRLALVIGFLFMGLHSLAEAAPTVTLTQPAHFATSNGSDVVAEAGTYQVEAVESRMTLSLEGQAPLLLDAKPTTHSESIESPLAVTVPGEDPDVIHIVLVLPNGQALDAPGSLSGTRSRALAMMLATPAQIQYAVVAQVMNVTPSVVATPPGPTAPAVTGAGTTGVTGTTGSTSGGPLAPVALPQALEGVVLYEHPNFGGRNITLGVGKHRFYGGTDFNDLTSSIKVPPGLVAFLYEHADEGGGYGVWVDLLEDHPDLAQLYFESGRKNFSDKLSYVEVVKSPNSQGLVWVRASVQNGQFIPGHWERPQVGGTPVNTVAVVSPPIPPHAASVTTKISVSGAISTIGPLGEQSQFDALRWESARRDSIGVIGSDFRGVEVIGSAAFQRVSPGIIPNWINFWYPQKQPRDQRTNPYFKRTLVGTSAPTTYNPHIVRIPDTYPDYDFVMDVKPSAPYQYLISEGHKPEEATMEAVKDRFQSAEFTDPYGDNTDKCTKPFTTIEAEIDASGVAKLRLLDLVRAGGVTGGSPVAVYGPWIYDKGHCHHPEIHPAEQIWWRGRWLGQGPNYYYLNLFCDTSGRFWWRDQMDDGTKLKPWGAPPIRGTFAIAFETQIGQPTKVFEATDIDRLNVATVPNSNQPHNLWLGGSRLLVSFIPRTDVFKVSYENVGLKPGTTNIVRGFLVLEATVGTVKQIKTQLTVFPAKQPPQTLHFPPGTDPNTINQIYERQVFSKEGGHYMFRIQER